jgi:hypothetical protein
MHPATTRFIAGSDNQHLTQFADRLSSGWRLLGTSPIMALNALGCPIPTEYLAACYQLQRNKAVVSIDFPLSLSFLMGAAAEDWTAKYAEWTPLILEAERGAALYSST